ncbi:MAG TPA: transglycosylase family protein [Acidimicrobiales bacterium]|jgi:hypothetical protein
MRTRIALVAIIPIALITVSTLTPAATLQPARAAATSSSTTKVATAVAMPAHQLAAYHRPADRTRPGPTGLLLPLDPAFGGAPGAPAVVAAPRAPTVVAAPATAPASPPPATVAPAGPVDTVTPAQRAAWERVAMCEEGGNWAYAGSRFSGGLGISRDNWAAYGGRQFAPVGAMATEDQQIMVAQRIQSSPPDQYGCRGW